MQPFSLELAHSVPLQRDDPAAASCVAFGQNDSESKTDAPMVPFDLECLEMAKALMGDSSDATTTSSAQASSGPEESTAPQHSFEMPANILTEDNDVVTIMSQQSMSSKSSKSSRISFEPIPVSAMSDGSVRSKNRFEMSESILQSSDLFTITSQSLHSLSVDLSRASKFSMMSMSQDPGKAQSASQCKNNSISNLLGFGSGMFDTKETSESPAHSFDHTDNKGTKRRGLDSIFSTGSNTLECIPNGVKNSGWSAPTKPFERDWDNLADLLRDDAEPKSPKPSPRRPEHKAEPPQSTSKSSKGNFFEKECHWPDPVQTSKNKECRTAPNNCFERDWRDVTRLLQSGNSSTTPPWAPPATVIPDSKPSAMQQCLSLAESLHKKHPTAVIDHSNSALPTNDLSLNAKGDDDFLELAKSLLNKNPEEKKHSELPTFGSEIKRTTSEVSLISQKSGRKNDNGFDDIFKRNIINKSPSTSNLGILGNELNETLFASFKQDNKIKKFENLEGVLKKSATENKQDAYQEKLPFLNSLKDQKQGNLLSLTKSKCVKFGLVQVNVIDSDPTATFNCKAFSPAINLDQVKLGKPPSTDMTVNEYEFRRQVMKNFKSVNKRNARSRPRVYKAPRRIGKKKHMRIIKNILHKVYNEVPQNKAETATPTSPNTEIKL